MEKEIIIHFLNEHWDEFADLLSETANADAGRTLMEKFPDDFFEFANLLSKMMTVQQRQAIDKQTGLLEKAQQFRKNDSLNDEEEHTAIIVKNGLFMVQPQRYNEALNSSFKTLVDSVL
ncbi:hypothetical protein [Treponema sp. OMZ 855]|uniref:hypothetical protein n=1 Tax=Treponema sp. OMZ 855 TaxID=1643512 RepID=UPI0020A2CCDE|nr:hypothetical protein [Treponema sp. OMZ 855]UTC51191.1 hypothetical protein E4N65_02265 [Treponema sp. OMZ 855]